MGHSQGLVLKYFVLNPTKDDPYGEASRQAMRTYARIIREHNAGLAFDLRAWLDDIEAGIKREKGA